MSALPTHPPEPLSLLVVEVSFALFCTAIPTFPFIPHPDNSIRRRWRTFVYTNAPPMHASSFAGVRPSSARKRQTATTLTHSCGVSPTVGRGLPPSEEERRVDIALGLLTPPNLTEWVMHWIKGDSVRSPSIDDSERDCFGFPCTKHLGRGACEYKMQCSSCVRRGDSLSATGHR